MATDKIRGRLDEILARPPQGAGHPEACDTHGPDERCVTCIADDEFSGVADAKGDRDATAADADEVSAALKAWRETLDAADDLMKRTIAEARRVRNATVDEAMKACTAVLETKAPEGIRITVGEATNA